MKVQTFLDIVFFFLAVTVLAVGINISAGNLASIGLALDAAGFVLVFGYGLPSRFATNWDVGGVRYLFANCLSWVGAALVIMGFVFQLVAEIDGHL